MIHFVLTLFAGFVIICLGMGLIGKVIEMIGESKGIGGKLGTIFFILLVLAIIGFFLI